MSGSSWPSYSEEEIDAVSAVLRSGKVNYWTGGEGRAFEKEFASFWPSERGLCSGRCGVGGGGEEMRLW